MIVVEGVDNSGKSTLIRALRVVLPAFFLQASEGPPKYPGEQNKRVKRYLGFPNDTIYDRHPCVSQPIYGTMRMHTDAIDPALIESFYQMDPLFIYCDGGVRGMKDHVFNPEVDSIKHLTAVEENYTKLLTEYRHWAAQHAFMSYRIGDSVSRIVKTVEKLIRDGRA
jgi:hypothetical protein